MLSIPRMTGSPHRERVGRNGAGDRPHITDMNKQMTTPNFVQPSLKDKGLAHAASAAEGDGGGAFPASCMLKSMPIASRSGPWIGHGGRLRNIRRRAPGSLGLRRIPLRRDNLRPVVADVVHQPAHLDRLVRTRDGAFGPAPADRPRACRGPAKRRIRSGG